MKSTILFKIYGQEPEQAEQYAKKVNGEVLEL